MANDEHLAMLKQGVNAWNAWRRLENPLPHLSDAKLRDAVLSHALFKEANLSGADLREASLGEANFRGVDLSGAILTSAFLDAAYLVDANLTGADLRGAILSDVFLSKANLTGANLSGAYLREAKLYGANLSGANLSEAYLSGAHLDKADLSHACLGEANLEGADLSHANFREANLTGANLMGALLLDTDFTGADLTGCRIFGVSAWRLNLEKTNQKNLVITSANEPVITVDNIEVAQFIYLMLHNEKVRDIIDTITSKAVLILGRFTEERKPVLDALRDELRKRGHLPIMFDFEKPRSRDTDETITLLARMAKFIIADVSDAKAVLQELRGIVPDLPSVAVQPIIVANQDEPGMFDHYRHMQWVLPVHRYADQEQLLADLGDKVIRPAELKVQELRGIPAR